MHVRTDTCANSKLYSSRLLPTRIRTGDNSACCGDSSISTRQESSVRQVILLSSETLSCASPTQNREPPNREILTSNFANGADNHGLVVGRGKHLAVAGALALLRDPYGHHCLRLRPQATGQVPLQQLRTGQDDPVVGEKRCPAWKQKKMDIRKGCHQA